MCEEFKSQTGLAFDGLLLQISNFEVHLSEAVRRIKTMFPHSYVAVKIDPLVRTWLWDRLRLTYY